MELLIGSLKFTRHSSTSPLVITYTGIAGRDNGIITVSKSDTGKLTALLAEQSPVAEPRSELSRQTPESSP